MLATALALQSLIDGTKCAAELHNYFDAPKSATRSLARVANAFSTVVKRPNAYCKSRAVNRSTAQAGDVLFHASSDGAMFRRNLVYLISSHWTQST